MMAWPQALLKTGVHAETDATRGIAAMASLVKEGILGVVGLRRRVDVDVDVVWGFRNGWERRVGSRTGWCFVLTTCT